MTSLSLLCHSASADLMVDAFNSTDSELSQSNRGFRFTVNTDQVITGLAVFDLDVLGLPFDIPVTLWNATTFAKLGELTIKGSGNGGVDSPLHPEIPGPYTSTGSVPPVTLRGYRFELFADHSLPDVTLLAGTTYLISANYFDTGGTMSGGQTADQELLQTLSSITVNSNFNIETYSDGMGGTFFGLTGSASGGPIIPPTVETNSDLIGPSVVFGSTDEPPPTVPEPSSAVLLGLGAIGLLIRSRRRKQV